jgi:hypothetical protein
MAAILARQSRIEATIFAPDQPAIGWNHPAADKLIDSNKLKHLLSAKVLTLLRTML